MSKKIFVIFALIILFTTAFISCKTESAETIEKITEQTVKKEDTSNESKDPNERVMPDLPDMDFNGKVFKVLGRDNATYSQFVNFEIDAAEITGDIVNDAVYNRNRRLEEKYNVVIEKNLDEEPAGLLQRLIKSGDDEYSLAFITQMNIGSMATSGMFCDLNSMKYLDFDKPWWNREVNKSVSVKNRLYFTTSDFNMMDKNRTYMLVYNKDMAQEYALGNLYDLVYENKWTIDKMTELSKVAAKDVDGDGLMTDADQWGYTISARVSFYVLFAGSGNSIVIKDSENNPVLSVNNEQAISTIDKILNLTNDKRSSFYCEDLIGKVSYDYWSAAGNVFRDKRALFSDAFPHSLKYNTASEVNYGVLPFPKYDENQKNYIGVVDPYHAAVFGIPITVQDTDFSAFMLEALSAASKYEVMPYFYEISTQTKYTHDEESPKMLDIIFNGIRYDLACLYNWGEICNILRWDIPESGVNNFVSSYEKIEAKVKAEMEKTIEAFKTLD